jgi:hypothetical protein
MTLRPQGGPAGSVIAEADGFRQASWSRRSSARPVTNGFVDLAGVEMRNFERVQDDQVFAVPLDILQGFRYRLLEALHVRQRRDHGLLQAGAIRPATAELLGENQRRRPVALLEKRVEQQLPDLDVVRVGDADRAQSDDRFVVPAGPEQRADSFMLPRGLRFLPASDV